MRPYAAVLLLLLVLALPAQADSWMAPQPELASSADGRWYVIVQPVKSWSDVHFTLVKRAEGKPARRMPRDVPSGLEDATRIKPEKGDKVVAKGRLDFMPMEIRCLNDGKGFVLFETYANLGHRTVLQRHDAQGKRLWSKQLRDFFNAKRIGTFSHTVSSIWWYEGVWIDERAGEIVAAWEAKQDRGVLRVSLKTGKHRSGAPQDLLAHVGSGAAQERIDALESAAKWKLDGLLEVVQAAFAKASTPMLARLHFAEHLRAAGDRSGKAVMLAAAAADQPADVREYAIRHLSHFLPSHEAIPHLRDAMRSKDDAVWRASEEALRNLGARAVETLAEMILDSKESERYRAGAATALWNMGLPAAPALPALKKAANTGLPKLEYAAKHAIAHIEKLQAKKKR